MDPESAAPKGTKRRIDWSAKYSKGRWEPIDEAVAALGANITFLAQTRGLSIKGLADKAGLTEVTLHNILAQRSLPHFSTLMFLAHNLKVDPSDLLLPNRKLRAKVARKGRTRRQHSR